MPITNIITRIYQDSGEVVTGKFSPAQNDQDIFDQNVAFGTDTHYVFNLKRSALVAMALVSDQDVTFATNGTAFSSPPLNTDKIALKAGRVYLWELAQDGLTPGPGLVSCPITADITTGIYITNVTSPPVTARVRIKALANV